MIATFLYQVLAFVRHKKPAVYFMELGAFDGQHFEREKARTSRAMALGINFLLRNYKYIYTTIQRGKNEWAAFFFYHGATDITKQDLETHDDRKIGLALGYPKFAVESFGYEDHERYAVQIKSLGLVFTVPKNKESLAVLRVYAEQNGIQERKILLHTAGTKEEYQPLTKF